MRWEDERWVKLYTRDTTDWLTLPWQAQGLFALILRKVDRAGILPLGRHGKRGLAAHIGGPVAWPEIEPHLDALLADGCVELRGDSLVIPNFMAAQEAAQSDSARKRTQRERARATIMASDAYVTNRDPLDTNRDFSSRAVSSGHAESHQVTPGHDPSRPVTLDQIRSDETRQDNPPNPPEGGGGGVVTERAAKLEKRRREAREIAAKILGQNKDAWTIWEALIQVDNFCALEALDRQAEEGALARQAEGMVGALITAGVPTRIDLALGAIAHLENKVSEDRIAEGSAFVLPMKAFASRLFGIFREWIKARGDPYQRRQGPGGQRKVGPAPTLQDAQPAGGQRKV